MLFFENISPNSTRRSSAVVVATLFESARGGSVDDDGCEKFIMQPDPACTTLLFSARVAITTCCLLMFVRYVYEGIRKEYNSVYRPILPHSTLGFVLLGAATVVSLGATLSQISDCRRVVPPCGHTLT